MERSLSVGEGGEGEESTQGKGNPAVRTLLCSNLKVQSGSLKKRNVRPSPRPLTP